MTDYKKLSIILAILCMGVALIFFILGMMFATYNIVQVVSAIKIEKVTVDLNETEVVNAIMKYNQLNTTTISEGRK